jgi:hypothetical protein
MGLGEILNVRAQEARQESDTIRRAGALQAEAARQKEIGRQMRQRELAETLGTAAGGFAGYKMGPEGQKLQSAAIGAQLGQGLGGALAGGARRPGGISDTGVEALSGIAQMEGQKKLLRRAQQQEQLKQDIALAGKFTPESIDLYKQTGEVSKLNPLVSKKEKAETKLINIKANEILNEKGDKKSIVSLLSGGKFTRDSILKYEESGNVADLVRSKKEEKQSENLRIKADQGRVGFNLAAKELAPLLVSGRGLTGELLESEFAGRFAGDKAKKIKAFTSNALDAILRFRTGAAVTPKELEFYQDMFAPRAGDSISVVKAKMNQLDDMLSIMEGKRTTDLGEEGLKALDKLVEIQRRGKTPTISDIKKEIERRGIGGL